MTTPAPNPQALVQAAKRQTAANRNAHLRKVANAAVVAKVLKASS